jgi:protocatechuate 3,4-dioxygenase beta subunit
MLRWTMLVLSLLVTLNLAAGELKGKVVDDDGNPVAGATVKDLWTDSKTTSDKDGGFTLKKTSTRPEPILTVNKPDYAQFVGIEQSSDDQVTITLTNKTWIEGKVLSPDGKPVPDALLRADSGKIDQNGYVMTSVWTETRSDKDGYFKFYLAPKVYDLQVRVPKVGAFRENITISSGDNLKRDIQLEKGVTFVANIVDSETNEPVPGVRLWSWQHKGVEGKSDDKGVVTIDGMQPGKFEFLVEKKGYVQWWSPQSTRQWDQQRGTGNRGRNFDDLEFDLAKDMPPATITVEKAVTITGKVLDPDDKPVKGATVASAATGSGNSITGDTRFSFTTKADGTFQMLLPSNKDRGDYNLVAHDGKYNQWRKWGNGVGEPFMANPGDKIENITLKLTNPGSVKGKVVDATGNPAVGVEVRAMMTDGRDNRYYVPRTKTDKDGNFELKHIRPGEAMIQAEPFWLDPKTAPAASTNIIEIEAGQVKEGVEITSQKQ